MIHDHDAMIIIKILFLKFNAAIMKVISISKAITVIFISTISLKCKVIATEVKLIIAVSVKQHVGQEFECRKISCN